MKEFQLIGYPLGHSLSPIIHKKLFEISGVDAVYSLNEIEPSALNHTKEKLLTLDGFNITIPHKRAIIPLLDGMSERASLFGAVNTVKVKNGQLIGHNTDCFGFIRSAKGAGIDIGGNVLLCGAGGVSRMFAFECLLAGASLTIAVRNKKKALPLQKEIKDKLQKDITVTDFESVNDYYDLLINGTPVGMFPNNNACVLNENQISKCKCVFDAIYNPDETLLLKHAKKSGAKYINGLPMLVWQAAVAQEIWNGTKFSDEDIVCVTEFTRKEAGII